MLKSRVVAVLLAATVAGCEKPPPAPPPPRPVRTVTVEPRAEGDIVSLTGQVRAKEQVSLAFRIDGRMVSRLVHAGDAVTTGQVVARLAPQNEQNALRSAQATLSAAEAVLTQARLTFGRQQELLKSGWTARAKFDDAQQALETAQAQADSAQAQLRLAKDQLSYTVLTADGPGVITATGAEPGEVVRAGQMVVQVARQGGIDAVFDASEQIMRTGPRDPVVEIALTGDAGVKATGRIREVAPQADANTRTFQVKVAIADPPEALRLGSTVTGRIRLASPPGTDVPASALTEADGHAAVWVFDPRSQTVSLHTVEVAQYDAAGVRVAHGLDAGDIVVTAGVQMLHPGQKVRLMGTDR
jgi:membrane fusion protein, multidrug efflux system